jgi:hypothetical protein
MENLDIIVLSVVCIVIIWISLHLMFPVKTENMVDITQYGMYNSGSDCNCRTRTNHTSDNETEDIYNNVYNDYEPHIIGPWWNSTRFNRNSSWDIRGDVPINPVYVGPWLVSPLL